MPDFPVESINVCAFAQAIGDHDPVHVDPTTDVRAGRGAGRSRLSAATPRRPAVARLGSDGRPHRPAGRGAAGRHGDGSSTSGVARATVDVIDDDERGRVAQLAIATFNQHGVEVLRGRGVADYRDDSLLTHST